MPSRSLARIQQKMFEKVLPLDLLKTIPKRSSATETRRKGLLEDTRKLQKLQNLNGLLELLSFKLSMMILAKLLAPLDLSRLLPTASLLCWNPSSARRGEASMRGNRLSPSEELMRHLVTHLAS